MPTLDLMLDRKEQNDPDNPWNVAFHNVEAIAACSVPLMIASNPSTFMHGLGMAMRQHAGVINLAGGRGR